METGTVEQSHEQAGCSEFPSPLVMSINDSECSFNHQTFIWTPLLQSNYQVSFNSMRFHLKQLFWYNRRLEHCLSYSCWIWGKMFTGSSCRLTHRHLQCRVYKRLQPERTQNVGVIYWNCIEMRKDAVKVNYMSVNVDKLWTYLRWIDQTCHAWCSKFASLVNVANVANRNCISTSSKIFSEDL